MLGYDYEGHGPAAPVPQCRHQLLKHRDVLEARLWGASKSLFSLAETVTLYDLTNTYFEGTAAGIRKARRGHSKDRHPDLGFSSFYLEGT